MGDFKYNTKMMSSEPSTVLKLKKGGSAKKHVAEHEKDCSVTKKSMGGAMTPSMIAQPPSGSAPLRPSMMQRMMAMKPTQRTPTGGAPSAPPVGSSHGPMNPQMNPNLLKKGGKVKKEHESKHEEHQEYEHEKRKKEHEKLVERKDHKQEKAKHKKDHQRYAAGGVVEGNGTYVEGKQTHTTIKGNDKHFLETKMLTAQHHNPAKSSGKAVHLGNAGGYAAGGTIEGNEHNWLHTKTVTAQKHNSAKSTGKAVKMGHTGYATGGTIEGNEHNFTNGNVRTARPNGNHSGTGDVHLGNAGGYKKGGAAKKHFAEGGDVVCNGKPMPYPVKQHSAQVRNNMQSGTYKKGGDVCSDKK